MAPIPVHLTYQSQHIDFSEWISLFTLCLSPLVAHIFAGAPEPIVLKGPKPRWHDRICHLNPTQIFWRYYVIAIRRCGAKCWSPADMAATNAVFWTGEEWDGSEEMVIKSRKFITRHPSGTRIRLMSGSTMTTLLVTIQGIQAVVGLVKGLRLGGYALQVALPNIFLPLALAGLYRLPASLWLTEEYGYATIDSGQPEIYEPLTQRSQGKAIPIADPPTQTVVLPLPTISPARQQQVVQAQHFVPSKDASFLCRLDTSEPLYSQKDWRVIVVKIFFLSTITVLCALSIYYFKPNPRITSGTASTLTINLFYMIFLFVTLVTTALYTASGQCNTTIIPCISSTWYRIYTYLLFLFALWLVIASALETRRTFCGEYTTYSPKLGLDHFICPDPYTYNIGPDANYGSKPLV